MNLTVTVAVEGATDEIIVKRLLKEGGFDVAWVHGLKGKQWLDRHLHGYNRAAAFAPWLVVRDLDRDGPCPSALRSTLLPKPAKGMALRIAVRSIEAWLLADAERLSEFLRVPRSKLPVNPDALDNPKQFVVNLARRSRSGDIRADMVPAEGMSSTQGPAYATRIMDFAANKWRPRVAAKHSDSLRRCLNRVAEWRR